MVDLNRVISEVINSLAPKKAAEFIVEFRKQLKNVVRNEMASALKAEVLRTYDRLARDESGQFGFGVQGDDPSSLEKWRHLFEQQVDKELANISFGDDEIAINICDLGDLGKGQDSREGSPQTVDWLIFYIEGNIGDFAFITPEHWKLRHPGRGEPSDLGRFGEGFMITREIYKSQRWEAITGLSFSDVRHPISGQKPYRDFEKIPEKFDFSSFVITAVQRAATAVSD